MKYGVPYQGSKSAIADIIVNALPSGGTFYDLFSGGCAISHCAALSKKWNRVFINDVNPFGPKLFLDAVNGELPSKEKFVSRNEFLIKKDVDSYISIMWSFGNNQRDYMYSMDLEPKKLSAHAAYFKNGDTPNIRLQHLERRRRLDKIKTTFEDCDTKLEINCSSYSDVCIEGAGVIYCDIPYEKTNNRYKLSSGFCYGKFYEWARSQTLPVYVSSYQMPKDGFEEVLAIDFVQRLSSSGSSKVTEKLFVAKK